MKTKVPKRQQNRHMASSSKNKNILPENLFRISDKTFIILLYRFEDFSEDDKTRLCWAYLARLCRDYTLVSKVSKAEINSGIPLPDSITGIRRGMQPMQPGMDQEAQEQPFCTEILECASI